MRKLLFAICTIIATLALGQNLSDKIPEINKLLDWESSDPDSIRLFFEKNPAVSSDTTNIYILFLKARIAEDSIQEVKLRNALAICSQGQDHHLTGLILYRIGREFSRRQEYDSAMSYYLRAHQYFDRRAAQSLIDKERRKCTAYTSQAFIANQTHDFEKGIEYSLLALRLSEENDFSDLSLVSYLNLSASYGELSSPDNRLATDTERHRYGLLAKSHMYKAADLAQSLGDLRRLHLSLGNIGTYFAFEDQLDSAKLYLNQAIEIGTEIEDYRGLANDYNMLSLVYQKNKQLDSAVHQAKNALKAASIIDSEQMKADILLSLAEIEIKQNNWSEAFEILTEVTSIANELKIPKTHSYALELMTEIAVQNGNWNEAYHYLKESVAYRDSVVSIENLNRIEELMTRYETEERKRQIENLQQEAEIADLKISQKNLLLIISVLGLVTALFIGYFILRHRSLKAQEKQLLLKQQLLRSQMNPHFLYNALSSIHAYLYAGNKDEAAEYLSTFSALTREVLNNSSREWITLKQEMDSLQDYIAIQQLRFPGVKFTLEMDDAIEADNLLVPPILIQPFAENAFEHGFKGKESGHLTVCVRINQGKLNIQILDDGAGFGEPHLHHESRAINMTKERLSILYGKSEFTLTLSSRSEGGVEVYIAIPIKEAL